MVWLIIIKIASLGETVNEIVVSRWILLVRFLCQLTSSGVCCYVSGAKVTSLLKKSLLLCEFLCTSDITVNFISVISKNRKQSSNIAVVFQKNNYLIMSK